MPTLSCGPSSTRCRLVLVKGCWIPMKSAGPMEQVLNEVDLALEHKLYYLAIVLALTLPDICSALEAADGRTTAERYKSWYDSYLASKFPNMSGEDCYSLRCGVVHQGRMGVVRKGAQFGRVLFSTPDGRGNVFHNCMLNDALQFDTMRFCREIIEAVRDWFSLAQSNPTVQLNLPNLVQYRPHGLTPYMVGIPIIA
jgi:hypothetical protein